MQNKFATRTTLGEKRESGGRLFCIDRQNGGILSIFEEKGNLRCKKICIDPQKGRKGSLRTNLFSIDLQEWFLGGKDG